MTDVRLLVPPRLRRNITLREQFAERIAAAWQKSVASIIEVGRVLIEAKDKLDHGEFGLMFERREVPFCWATGCRLMAIADHVVLSNSAHVQNLPASWGTLYQLSRLDPSEVERRIRDGTINADLERKDIRTWAKAKHHNVAAATFNAEGPFDVVVIDPPWPMQKIDRDVRPNQDAFDYPTMTIEQLQEFWPKEIEGRTNPDCHLFCWTTQKFRRDAEALVEQKWGYRCVFMMVWHKPGGFQPIGLAQYNCEFVIYARKGAPEFIDTTDFNCCFEAPRREHSRKPAIFYETIRRVTGGSRLDVFARERHEGFAQYGNEIEKFWK